MGINLSESIARLQLQRAALNSKNINSDGAKKIEDNLSSASRNNILDNSDVNSSVDSFSKSSENGVLNNKTSQGSDNVSVAYYKNAARAASMMSQYGNTFYLRNLSSSFNKNSS